MKDNGSQCLVSVDGTDFKIQEPAPFDKKWYDFKFNHAGVRYEIGICIQTGWIVWAYGPFPAGKYPDLKISKKAILNKLSEGEKLLADSGYSNGFFVTPTGLQNDREYMKHKARARHETCNGRFKRWGILNQTYRHNLIDHGIYFDAIANLTQLEIMYESELFSMDGYYDIESNEDKLHVVHQLESQILAEMALKELEN